MVEDLHWAETALLDMLEQLVARSTGPLLLVVTARPELLEPRPGWGSRRAASQLTLEPLTHDDSRRLVAELMPERRARRARPGGRDAPRATRSSPRRSPTTCATAAAAPTPGPLPSTVHAVLAARVDGLPADEKRALQDAAVVGRSFWASSLEATGSGPGAPDALRALEDRGLVVTRPSSSLPGQTELWFRHALIREVAYRSIPDAQRRTVHGSVGDWLEALARDRRDEFVELLAHHFERAAAGFDGAGAREGGRDAAGSGTAARQRAATDDAVQFADRALALARGAPTAWPRSSSRLARCTPRSRPTRALAAYQAAMDLARGADADRLRAQATLLCARYPGAFTRPDWRRWAVDQIEAGLAGDADQRDSFDVGALLIGRASMVRWFVLDAEELTKARRAAERAIEIAERIGSMQLLSHGLEALGWRDADHGFCEAAPRPTGCSRSCAGCPTASRPRSRS